MESLNPKTELGYIRVANEVVATIAGLAASEVDGVTALSGGLGGGIAEMLGRKNLTRGVKVEVGEREAAVDMNIIVDFGAKIPDVAKRVQESVKNSIEAMTGLTVVEVNVHIQGVAFSSDHGHKEDERLK